MNINEKKYDDAILVNLPKDLKKQLKKRALDMDTSYSVIVRDLLIDFLEINKPKRKLKKA